MTRCRRGSWCGRGAPAPSGAAGTIWPLSGSGSTRMFRVRVWLASAMWLPVLAANLLAVGLGIGLPLLDEALSDRPRLPIPLSVVEQIMGALAAGMITFTGIVFSAVFVA